MEEVYEKAGGASGQTILRKILEEKRKGRRRRRKNNLSPDLRGSIVEGGTVSLEVEKKCHILHAVRKVVLKNTFPIPNGEEGGGGSIQEKKAERFQRGERGEYLLYEGGMQHTSGKREENLN